MTEETVRSHHGREVFLTSSVGQQQNSRGAPESPLAGKLAALNAAAKAEWDYRPDAFWPRSTMHVEAAFATNRFSSSVMVHST